MRISGKNLIFVYFIIVLCVGFLHGQTKRERKKEKRKRLREQSASDILNDAISLENAVLNFDRATEGGNQQGAVPPDLVTGTFGGGQEWTGLSPIDHQHTSGSGHLDGSLQSTVSHGLDHGLPSEHHGQHSPGPGVPGILTDIGGNSPPVHLDTHVDLPGEHGNTNDFPVVHRSSVMNPGTAFDNHASDVHDTFNHGVHIDEPGQHGNTLKEAAIHVPDGISMAEVHQSGVLGALTNNIGVSSTQGIPALPPQTVHNTNIGPVDFAEGIPMEIPPGMSMEEARRSGLLDALAHDASSRAGSASLPKDIPLQPGNIQTVFPSSPAVNTGLDMPFVPAGAPIGSALPGFDPSFAPGDLLPTGGDVGFPQDAFDAEARRLRRKERRRRRKNRRRKRIRPAEEPVDVFIDPSTGLIPVESNGGPGQLPFQPDHNHDHHAPDKVGEFPGVPDLGNQGKPPPVVPNFGNPELQFPGVPDFGKPFPGGTNFGNQVQPFPSDPDFGNPGRPLPGIPGFGKPGQALPGIPGFGKPGQTFLDGPDFGKPWRPFPSGPGFGNPGKEYEGSRPVGKPVHGGVDIVPGLGRRPGPGKGGGLLGEVMRTAQEVGSGGAPNQAILPWEQRGRGKNNVQITRTGPIDSHTQHHDKHEPVAPVAGITIVRQTRRNPFLQGLGGSLFRALGRLFG